MQQRKFGFYQFLVFAILPILTFILGFAFSEKKNEQRDLQLCYTTTQESQKKSTEKELKNSDEKKPEDFNFIDLSITREVLEIIEKKFLEPEKIDSEKIKFGMIRGLVWSLGDPFSEFLTPEENAELNDDLSGDLEGIGAELTLKNNLIVIVSPLRDSPAEKAGLLPEDVILKVDGEIAEGNKFLEIVKKIRGKQGTKVELEIMRKNLEKPKKIKVVRDKIRIETVELEFNEEIAILEVSQFGENTKEEFEKALQKAITKNAQGIILDLRFNAGGFLQTAVEMVSNFVESGKVVVEKYRPPMTKTEFVTGNFKTDLPLVILQNGGSASASEIVAGAIQDLNRGVVIGETSFGKGTVQELIPVSGGGSIRITIAKWLTPNGRSISEVGITPDLEIKMTADDFQNNNDFQLEAALQFLRGKTLQELKQELAKEKL